MGALLKRKILDIKDEIEQIIKPLCKEKLWINWYGAYDIDPKNLVFWVCVQSDKMKMSFESDTKLTKQLVPLLVFFTNKPSEWLSPQVE